MRIYDDSDDRKQLAEFVEKYTDESEVRRRGAATYWYCDLGYSQPDVLETELPVVIYLDENNNVVSHKIYEGRLTRELMQRRWQPIITERENR